MRSRLKSDACDLLRDLFKAGKKLTAFDVEVACKIDVRNAREHLKALHSAAEIYVMEWRRDAAVGPWAPVYMWRRGCEIDAVRPKPKVWMLV